MNKEEQEKTKDITLEDLGYTYFEHDKVYLKSLTFPDRINTEYILFKRIEKTNNNEIMVRFYKTDALITKSEELPITLSTDELRAIMRWLNE